MSLARGYVAPWGEVGIALNMAESPLISVKLMLKFIGKFKLFLLQGMLTCQVFARFGAF